jgi:hypothetical protein|tara:strand:+ start:2494 stop:2658 length:165 start_codon:yes stop_codon:yes gene_type:complete
MNIDQKLAYNMGIATALGCTAGVLYGVLLHGNMVVGISAGIVIGIVIAIVKSHV